MSNLSINLIQGAATVLIILINGFFVAAEFALVKIRDTQLQPLVAKGHKRAKLARNILGNLDSYLSACQLGITLASLALMKVGDPLFERLLHPVMLWIGIESERWQHAISFGVGYSLLTFLHIIVGEQGPKFLAIKRPLESSLQVAYPLKWFFYATYPFIWFLNVSSLWFLRQFGIDAQGEHGHGAEHSSDELRLMVAARQREPGEGALGQEIVLNAFDLRFRTVRDIMRPRHEIVALDTTASIAECIEIADRTRYSRFPLVEDGNLDRTLGVVHFKDLFAARHTAKTANDLRGVARKLIYVPENARLEKVLGLFLERKLHFAIVVDEYGGSTGVVTLENCLEQLVGEIQDEFDQEKPRVIARGEDEWELEGTLPLFELAELIAHPIPAEGVTSVGGWLTQRLGGFPKRGDRVSLANHDFVVDELSGLRVAKVTVRRRSRTATGDTTLFTPPPNKAH